ncbi:EAL and HDOD domain-containing protein [Acetobacterium sp.]|uniref:EAL and HDOD domain-containing protein n=1 Tax=Acetobacterium sp. TaxID=1872094 RepID=UPI000CB099F3|nr:EAL domain-containing protein [Acetobacterium sp.]MDO9491461.1 EAL domain-containing protein [Acetobacterium sp.]PKM75130.1 MAG: diguanylate phosphodiesterase [Firmicutes bacterium HGW-Firmicutes-17]
MFIARQPIFNAQLEVYGYELLFRLNSQSTQFGGVSSQGATAMVITGLFESGLENLIEDKIAFINFDEIFIHSEAVELIKPDRMIVEMLENIEVSSNLMERLTDIKAMGYSIALDDFAQTYQTYPLTPLADIIKYDIMVTPLDTIVDDIPAGLAQGKTLLAEKVETQDEFVKAKAMGFTLFQGYFFSKPRIAGRSFRATPSQIQYLQLMSEINADEPSFERLAELIEQDVTLTYRLLRLASFRAGSELISSIKFALSYIGLKEFERWISILMIHEASKDKPTELIKISLIRTRFAESLAKRAGMIELEHDAALMGLFSVLDAILDLPMDMVLAGIVLPQSILDALIKEQGILLPIYELMLAYEKGDWVLVEAVAQALKIEDYCIYHDYREAIKWANTVIGNIA